jgi:hypothetical protein
MEVNAAQAIRPFDAPAAYLRERQENQRLYGLLSRSLTLLRLECNRRELRGEDVNHVRDFIREASA